MAVGAIVARILTQYSDKGSKAAQKDIAKLGKNFDEFSRRAVRAFGVAAAAASAFAVKIGKDSVQAAIADQKSQTLLANSLRNTTGATNAAIASVEAYVASLQLQVGVADDDLRPALSRLAAVTGNVASAQQMLGIALDISAQSGADLNTATGALVRGLQGNFRTLQKLVPSLDAATVKSKDFAAILAEVTAATQGAAAARANTLEFRLAILRIRFNEILETLGYALLPVLEEFAKVLQSEVLPQIAKWIDANKRGLAEGLRSAAKAALELLKAAVAFGAWVVENFNTIKNFGILLASIWATGRIYSFITAIGKVTLAFKSMQTAAIGAGAASAAAGAGSAGAGAAFLAGARSLGLVGLGATGIAALTFGLGKIDLPGTRTRAKRLAAEQEARLAGYKGAPGPSDLATINNKPAGKKDDSFAAYLDFIDRITAAQNKLNNSKKKQLTVEQKIINATLKQYGLTLMTGKIEAKATAEAIRQNLNRQDRIAKAAPTVSLAAQGNGSATGSSITGTGTPNVNVVINTPVGTAEDFNVKVSNDLRTTGRRTRGRSGGGGSGFAME